MSLHYLVNMQNMAYFSLTVAQWPVFCAILCMQAESDQQYAEFTEIFINGENKLNENNQFH